MTTRNRTRADVPATRIVYYPDPTITDPHTALARHTIADLEARRREDAVLYARWVQRQAIIAERDRRTRRILIWTFAGIGTTVLAGLGIAGWLAYRAIATTAANATAADTAGGGSWLLGLALGAIVLAGAVYGGHKCITIIEHRH